jgi:hypothetical protein
LIVDNETIYYFPWHSGSSEEIIFEIEKNPKIKKLVIFGPQEYEPLDLYQNTGFHIMFDTYLKYKGIKLFNVVNTKTDKFINRADTIAWEDFFAFSTVYGSIIDGEKYAPMGHSKITSPFISLNRSPHPHRCFFIDMLAKYNLIDTGIVTWHEYGHNPTYNFEFWKNRSIKTLPNDSVSDSDNGERFKLYKPPSEFSNSLFSLVCESTPHLLFVTEKTFMPIYHKRPFLIAGAKNFHAHLKGMGFKLFDEVIDYSFDSLDTYEDRVNALMEQVKVLCNHNPNKLLNTLKPKLSHNMQNLLNILKNRPGVDSSVKKLAKKISRINPQLSYYDTLINFPSTTEFEIECNKILKGL